MDIQKQHEDFDLWWEGNAIAMMCEEDEALKIWQAAKAQAVPNKYHMQNIRDALVIACDTKEDEGRFEDSLNYIHNAMIEAQEQSK